MGDWDPAKTPACVSDSGAGGVSRSGSSWPPPPLPPSSLPHFSPSPSTHPVYPGGHLLETPQTTPEPAPDLVAMVTEDTDFHGNHPRDHTHQVRANFKDKGKFVSLQFSTISDLLFRRWEGRSIVGHTLPQSSE